MSASPPLALSTAPLEHPAMDYAVLRREGIRHLERLAGRLWTDFNAHDPGITILEQLCYAITDLGYRVAYELPDLLAGDDVDGNVSLPSPATILTSHPVTLDDLRKLVLDVEGVRNAWVQPLEEPGLPVYFHEGAQELRLEAALHGTERLRLKGLYRVLVEKSPRADSASVQRAVARRLHANRPLCEDFAIEVLESQAVTVDARVEIGPVEDAERVLLEIFHHLSNYLSPPVPFATLDELLAAGRRVDEVFEGPALEHGFLDAAALRESTRRTAVYVSDLIHEIMSVSGVRAVSHIAVAASPRGEPQAWSLELLPNHVARLDFDRPKITLQRAGLPVTLDVGAVVRRYADETRASTRGGPVPAAERDLAPPRGRPRNVGAYHSIQQQLPPLYGIGEMGLAESAAPSRKALAKQLKAYLLFFDQLLANYFSQLANVPALFAFETDEPRTYFAEPVDGPGLGLDEIRARAFEEHRAWLQTSVEATVGAAEPGQRRDRFLSHLLARFAEEFTDYSLVLFGALPEGAPSLTQKLILDKQAFLRRYPRISSARGTAVDYLADEGPADRSGLEERLALKLGLDAEAGERFLLVEHILLRPLPEDARQLGPEGEPQVPLLRQAHQRDPYSLQLSVVFPAWPARFRAGGETSGFRRFLEQTVREETPAHLTPYVHWLDESEWRAFELAYLDWRKRHHAYWAHKLGL